MKNLNGLAITVFVYFVHSLAFTKSITFKLELEPYTPVRRHRITAGTHLSAATLYATLFNLLPMGLKYNVTLGPALALNLQ